MKTDAVIINNSNWKSNCPWKARIRVISDELSDSCQLDSLVYNTHSVSYMLLRWSIVCYHYRKMQMWNQRGITTLECAVTAKLCSFKVRWASRRYRIDSNDQLTSAILYYHHSMGELHYRYADRHLVRFSLLVWRSMNYSQDRRSKTNVDLIKSGYLGN